jgi:two-component system, chemotaxis family, chemotaxis protein CheY
MIKILAVDDSKIIRRILSGAIEALGHETLEAENGLEALEVIKNNPGEVVLILLDWNMPELDGYATLKALKSDPITATIPVMMVTTESEKTNIIKAIQAGASHYLTKPFTQEDLMTRMLECMEA